MWARESSHTHKRGHPATSRWLQTKNLSTTTPYTQTERPKTPISIFLSKGCVCPISPCAHTSSYRDGYFFQHVGGCGWLGKSRLKQPHARGYIRKVVWTHIGVLHGCLVAALPGLYTKRENLAPTPNLTLYSVSSLRRLSSTAVGDVRLEWGAHVGRFMSTTFFAFLFGFRRPVFFFSRHAARACCPSLFCTVCVWCLCPWTCEFEMLPQRLTREHHRVIASTVGAGRTSFSVADCATCRQRGARKIKKGSVFECLVWLLLATIEILCREF